ncbi:hypothetical protein [Saccharopolyspora sp. 6V]|uniref:hypothetical protein n=1 Tax=Saccharopolyspora sp. 6V TaxID=2877239 RepID=UPI001CD2CD6E|nr:hypothetical protein [Saccharopolyspora sp. 6V]MCA1191625.1 hypothetical protein [Saccharopolyspora sp. 6V]
MPEELPRLTLGWEVVRAATKYLKHPNGPRAGLRWEFVDSQIRFLLHWYAVNEDGSWVYHHGVRRLAKGSGKSPFAALIAIAELCFPVRLKDFDPRVPGGCVGQPVSMPLVQIAATAESQTANTMRMVRAFAPKGSRIAQDFQLDPGKTKYFKAPEGTLEVLTASSRAAEGAEGTALIADETEHWLPSNGGPEFAATLRDNLAKSGSRMLETCNAWEPGLESVAEDSWRSWLAQEEGRVRGDGRVLYDARIAAPETDLRDDASLTAALEWVYDDCWWANLKSIKQRIWSPDTKADDAKRKYLNWPTAALDAWTTQQAWAQLVDASKSVADKEPIAMFFDGSRSRDATGLVGCRISDGHVFVLGAWEPEISHEAGKQDFVPVAAVDAAVRQAFDRFDVQGFFADVREWESFVRVDWPAEFSDRLLVQAVPTGKTPEPIAWDMRGHTYEFTQACELFEAEIRSQQFTHDGNSVLARHVANARRRPNRYGVSIGKESPDSRLKIDLAVCAIGARWVRRQVLAAAGKRRIRSGKVW